MFGLFLVIALGAVCLHQRGSRLAGLQRGARWVFALSLAAPAMWLASTQVYPDLVAGLLLGCAFVELAIVEREKALGRVGTAIVTVSLVIAPWLHIKNVAAVVIATVVLVILALRVRPSPLRLGCTLGLPTLSLVGFLAYNQYFFGRIGGLPQPGQSIGTATGWNSIALLVDRHQGLVIQVPTVVLGVVGLAIAVRRIPVAAIGCTCAMAVLLVVNASYTAAPFGGTSFAGRFEWTIAPMLLAWGGMCIARMQVRGHRLVVVGIAIAILWILQAIPILERHHGYVNEAVAPFRPWDPMLYPGWWGVLDRYLPAVVYPRGQVAGGLGAFALVVVVIVLGGWLAVRAGAAQSFGWAAALGAAVGVVLVVGAIVLSAHTEPEPTTTLSWSGRDLAGPWVTGAVPALYAPVPLADLGPGHYAASVSYRSDGPSPSGQVALIDLTPLPSYTVSHWLVWSDPTDARNIEVRTIRPQGAPRRIPIALAPVPPRRVGVATVPFSTGDVRSASFQLYVPDDTHLQILRLGLRKTGT